MINAPFGRTAEKAPRWDLMDTENYDGGIRVLDPYLIVWGYVDIYRKKEYVGGAPRAPRGRGRAQGGGCAPTLVAPPTYFLRLYILLYPKNIQEHHETLFPPPQPSVPVRSHPGAFSGAPPEGALITEGFYINTIASPMKCE